MIYFIENIVKYSRFSVSVNAICEYDRCVENAGFYFAYKKQGGGNVATLIVLILVMLLPAGIAEYGRSKGWWY